MFVVDKSIFVGFAQHVRPSCEQVGIWKLMKVAKGYLRHAKRRYTWSGLSGFIVCEFCFFHTRQLGLGV